MCYIILNKNFTYINQGKIIYIMKKYIAVGIGFVCCSVLIWNESPHTQSPQFDIKPHTVQVASVNDKFLLNEWRFRLKNIEIAPISEHLCPVIFYRCSSDKTDTDQQQNTEKSDINHKIIVGDIM